MEEGAEAALEDSAEEEQIDALSMKALLEAGVHFGHQTHRWNPRMKRS